MSGKQRFDISIHQINRRHSTTRLTMNYAKAWARSLVDKRAIDFVSHRTSSTRIENLTQVEDNLYLTETVINPFWSFK